MKLQLERQANLLLGKIRDVSRAGIANRKIQAYPTILEDLDDAHLDQINNLSNMYLDYVNQVLIDAGSESIHSRLLRLLQKKPFLTH